MDETSVSRLRWHLPELRVGTLATQPLDNNSGQDLWGWGGEGGVSGNRNLLIT